VLKHIYYSYETPFSREQIQV